MSTGDRFSVSSMYTILKKYTDKPEVKMTYSGLKEQLYREYNVRVNDDDDWKGYPHANPTSKELEAVSAFLESQGRL